MRLVDVSAEPDLVGRRLRVGWTFVLEGAETLADIPPVRLRRKLRDFAFPPPPADAPYLVYDSVAFPPPGTLAAELPGWERREGGERTTAFVDTVAQTIGGQDVELLRRTVATTLGADGLPRSRRVELLDVGGAPGALLPGITYYYELLPAGGAAQRVVAAPAEAYGMARTLYEALPAVYRRHDVVSRPTASGGAAWVPELAGRSGQLRRFLDPFGTALDLLRSSAEGLRGLHDLDGGDYRHLPLLAQWIGWELSPSDPVPLQRNELKHAPRLYRGVGTVPTLRAVVTRYSGWSTRVTEFAQSIARSNTPATLNLFALADDGAGWRGADDAGPALGFGPANAVALGSADVAALLTSTVGEPFALRPGLELAVAADGREPELVRFGPADFRAMAAATADEVVAVLNRTLAGVRAEVSGGRVAMRSERVGEGSAVRVPALDAALLSLEGAAAGRLSNLSDSAGRLRLVYAAGPPPTSQLRTKAFAYGAWGDSQPVGVAGSEPCGEPALAELPGGDLLLAWVERPHSAAARLRFARGTPRPPQPAILIAQQRGPYAGLPGTRLALRGAWAGPELIDFVAADFAAPGAATAVEVAAAINARSTRATASVQPSGALRLASVASGPEAALAVDARLATAALALGFPTGLAPARGAWSDLIDWGAADQVLAAPGRYIEPCAVRAADGGVWLFWAEHSAGTWQLFSARWSGVGWSAPELRAGGPGACREPYAARDAGDRIWLVWSRLTVPDDTWTLRASVFDPGAGTWGAELALTAPLGAHSADREPSLLLRPDSRLRLLFRSTRGGGHDLWSLTLDPAAPPANLVAEAPATLAPAAAPADSWPAQARLGGRTWLLFRSDRNVPMARAGLVAPGGPSVAAGDASTLRRFAGGLSAIPGHTARNGLRRQWGDLLAYTPSRPRGQGEGRLRDDEWYTRGSVGLYIIQADPDSFQTRERVERLRQLVPRFLPVNARAVIILAPSAEIEYIYGAGVEIGERYLDSYPFVEIVGAPVDAAAAVMPGVVVLRSNTPADRTADPGDLTTLRGRSYFPPLE